MRNHKRTETILRTKAQFMEGAELHWDWREAFAYASGVESAGAASTPIAAPPGSDVSVAPFTFEDVEEVLAAVEGENDESSWVFIGRLKDGRWATLNAHCDYTGWDCQAGGESTVAKSKDEAITFGLDADSRARLGLEAAKP